MFPYTFRAVKQLRWQIYLRAECNKVETLSSMPSRRNFNNGITGNLLHGNAIICLVDKIKIPLERSFSFQTLLKVLVSIAENVPGAEEKRLHWSREFNRKQRLSAPKTFDEASWLDSKAKRPNRAPHDEWRRYRNASSGAGKWDEKSVRFADSLARQLSSIYFQQRRPTSILRAASQIGCFHASGGWFEEKSRIQIRCLDLQAELCERHRFSSGRKRRR